MSLSTSPTWLPGLSPRMRGNLAATTECRCRERSIPAYAGEPRHQRNPRPTQRVYPRVCGGTTRWHHIAAAVLGLSPRMRGNPLKGGGGYETLRSIPAYAGEPDRLMNVHRIITVYPRVCGGTVPSTIRHASSGALSPRMRGNRTVGGSLPRSPRSIPAYAGEPASASARSRSSRVYPRVCGGTGRYRSPHRTGRGLSPRMRGNPRKGPAKAASPGSIPAYAGEPRLF